MNTWYQPEERAMFALRQLYRSRGYLPFKMSKFEEYDLYAASKDFLVSGSVITFTDRTGRLLALKPDVTLSIVKNYTYHPNAVEKVCYSERVYRPSGSTHEYKEIPQTGLECIGELDPVQIAEVVALAAQSLELLGAESVLELSHLGVLAAILDETGADEALRRRLIGCLSAKNAHDLRALCEKAGIPSGKLEALTAIHGAPQEALAQLRALGGSQAFDTALRELQTLCEMLDDAALSPQIHLDFSIVQDLRYYSGIVFRGYLPGIPERVLSGGSYDPLLRQMGKKGGAIGFAVYLDLLEQTKEEEKWDADWLLLYEEGTDPALVCRTAKRLSESGERVMTQRTVPEKLRFGQILRLSKGGDLT